jgi:predicted metal-binding protein
MVKSKEPAIKIDPIIALLKAEGASTALSLPVSHVIVDERVRLKCQVPLCDSFHKNLMCPPFAMSVEEFRKVLACYKEAILLQTEGVIDVPTNGKPNRDVFVPAGRLHDLVNLGEREAFRSGFRFAAGLIGGCCRLCEACVAIDNSRICRFPFRARPSMEAMGIDVVATLEQSGLTLTFPVRDRVTWTGLILLQ